jgi:hypothetical protein
LLYLVLRNHVSPPSGGARTLGQGGQIFIFLFFFMMKEKKNKLNKNKLKILKNITNAINK